jgi:diguanylate cyclase (GGDEF)-like protein/PAS domain S-box-containing protein
MQTFLDVIVAAFIFVLFAALYRKRSTVTVRQWMVGWLFILIHFAVALWNPHAVLWATLQTIVLLGSLVCCGIAFVLSSTRGGALNTVTLSSLLGAPWLTAIVLAALPTDHYRGAAFCAYCGSAAMVVVAVRTIRLRSVRTLLITLVALGCAGWLLWTSAGQSLDVVVAVVLTQVFGLCAVILSNIRRHRVTPATVTMSGGAIAWGLVWIAASVLQHLAPQLSVTPELWNLPKYFLAAGMILALLEEEIRSAELASEQYRVLFKSNPHPMWMYDPVTFDFLQANEAAVHAYGYATHEFAQMNLLQVLRGEDSPELRAKLGRTAPQQLTGPWQHRRKNGSHLMVDIACQPVLLEGRQVMFALMHDVTERERLHAQLLRQAHHDALTDVPNRDLFEQRFLEALDRARERGRKSAIFCIDLDRFKQINDSYGHLTGDVCLKEVTSRMNGLLDGRGTVGRCGGDEFLLCLADFTQVRQAEEFASELLSRLLAPVVLGSGELDLGASIGFAIYPDDEREPGQLWRDADAAMYQAKRAGGRQWVRVSTEIASCANEANEIELGLRRALKSGQLRLHYQPQIDADGQLHSLEALLRSDDPALCDVPTGRIIEIAEESRLIVPVGAWVVDEVCRQLREWLDNGCAPAEVAVNVSPLQLMRFDFSHQVAKTLERYRLSARMLEFEVTESTVMPDRGFDVPHQIANLARMGIRFAVDDFGTGYSSLGRLHELPVGVLKIDKSFTRRIGETNGTFPTVQAIIALAHTLGMKVVAEGVETEEQAALLQGLDCDRIQGFLYGRPEPAHVTTELLRQSQKHYLVRTVA